MLDRENTVLVVVDVQEPFLRSLFERDRVVNNVTKLVRAASILGVPIIATLQNKARMGGVIPEIAELLPDGEAIDKMTFSCCGESSFIDSIDSLGWNQVLLCGLETHVCLNQTAHDLKSRGHEVHIAADAVSSRKESDWKFGIERLRQAGIVITTTEMAIFELLRDAAAPEFKRILEIVK